jgi:hypothetical protein
MEGNKSEKISLMNEGSPRGMETYTSLCHLGAAITPSPTAEATQGFGENDISLFAHCGARLLLDMSQ